MPRKKVIRKPIEKLSEKESITIIEDSDSSSEEESFDEIPEVVIPKPIKKPRTQKQIDATAKMLETRKRNKEAKMKTAVSVPIVKEEEKPEPFVSDPDDIALTVKAYKALISQNKKVNEPKPKRSYVRKQKPISLQTSKTEEQMVFV